MQSAALDLTSRTRIASFLYKLAIRVQKAIKRPLDAEKVARRMNIVLNGAVSELRAHFTPANGVVSGGPPSLAKVAAHRTFVPGHGPGIRMDLFFGPLHLVKTVDGFGVVTSQTEKDRYSATGFSGRMETVDSLESIFPSKLGGVNSKLRVITSDVRDDADTEYEVQRAFEGGKRVWKIVKADTGEVAHYRNKESVKSNITTQETNVHLPEEDRKPLVDEYREAIFSSATEATRVLNELTRGKDHKSRVLPKFKQYLMYVQFSTSYLANLPAGQIGDGVFEVIEKLLPDDPEVERYETTERLERMREERRKELELQQKREEDARLREEERRQREFKKMMKR